MSNAIYKVPKAYNETVKSFAPGSSERAELKAALRDLKSQTIDINYI